MRVRRGVDQQVSTSQSILVHTHTHHHHHHIVYRVHAHTHTTRCPSRSPNTAVIQFGDLRGPNHEEKERREKGVIEGINATHQQAPKTQTTDEASKAKGFGHLKKTTSFAAVQCSMCVQTFVAHHVNPFFFCSQPKKSIYIKKGNKSKAN